MSLSVCCCVCNSIVCLRWTSWMRKSSAVTEMLRELNQNIQIKTQDEWFSPNQAYLMDDISPDFIAKHEDSIKK